MQNEEITTDSLSGNPGRPSGLKAGFTPLGMWAFSIGTSIGWGSFIVTCNTYLQKSGILGTILGLLLGMAVILVVTWNLQYIIRNSPSAGGIYTFVKKTNGKDLGFISMWFILLTYMAVLWANITSLPLFARFFLGDTFQFGFHYTVFGYEVWFGEALLSIIAVLLVGILCINSSKIPNYIVMIAALVFTVAFVVCAVIAMLKHDSSYSYSPFFTDGAPAFGQIVRIAVISPWAFIGFENIAHFSEEYTFPLKRIKRILIWSVVITTLLYIFVSLLSISAYPPEYDSWLDYIQDMGNLEGIKAVPAFYAAYHYLGQTGVVVLMIALFAVILTSLIGNMLALSRLLFAAGREGEAPRKLARLNRHSIPATAIGVIMAVSVLIPFLGRTAIGWIVDVTTLGAMMIYGLISFSVFRHSTREHHARERVTGLLGIILMICFILLLLIPGLLPFNAMETESYVLFIVWAVLGLLYFRILTRLDKKREYQQRILVWIILLVMVLFASMMWVSRETDKTAHETVHSIYEYNQEHAGSDPDEISSEDRVAFLTSQADKISSTNTLFTLVSLGVFLLFIFIMMNNYKDTKKLDQRLTVAEKEARDAKKIAELTASISSLLDNMPAMSFSKNADTGVYLACNQAFAEYARKDSPDDVTGLTDAQIFDPETAKQFEEDDLMALSMNEPYIFFEDVKDAAGNQRQLQTTKLKFIDANGRSCILGMCQDVTDMVRIQRENATTKEAYEKARSTGIIYTHIAQTLARGYDDLYYINHETGDYIEYHIDEETGTLAEIRRGPDFFESCVWEAREIVHQEDQAEVMKALEHDTLIEALDRNNSFIMTYRLLTEQGPAYFRMKVARMDDDDRFLVAGIANADEEVRQQKAAERMQEEHIAYTRINALAGDFLSVYVVDPETNRFRKFSSSQGFSNLSLPSAGWEFFSTSREMISQVIYPADEERFLSMFTKEGILSEIEKTGSFSLSYRLMLDGSPNYVRLRASMVEEKEGRRLIVGISDIESQVRQEEAYAKRLAQAQSKATIDDLTGVKNKNAYRDEEDRLDSLIKEGKPAEFAIVVLDVNNLKTINDTLGHQEGDRFICEACKIICDNFKKSPVFRIGGDEFTVLVQGDDYKNIDTLMENMASHNEDALQNDGIVIACGMSRNEKDECTADVLERADQEMYENKKMLKSLSSKGDPRR